MNKTRENLLKAFAGESMARNKYAFFAEQARKEGYEQIAAIFEETAGNERAHARRIISFVKSETPANLDFSGGPIGGTKANLETAIAGEYYETSKMYPEFEAEARRENEPEIADVFKELGEVEEKHEKRYRALLKNLTDGKVFTKDEPVKWKCRNCGYVHAGKSAPDKCPACGYPRSYYELLEENY